MKYSAFYLTLAIFITSCAGAPHGKQLPIKNGEYVFQHKYAEAEQYRIKSITLNVRVDGYHIIVINNDRDDVFPKGVLEEGTLMWHAKTGQWIIGHSPTDANAPDVGGCSDGPTVVDLEKRIYWTC